MHCATELETLATRYDYHSLRLIGRDELRGLIASERYSSALYDSNGGHLHPYRYTLGLGRAAAQAGVAIFENSWVTRLDVAQNASADNLAHTAQGTVRARHLLIAGGALLGRLVPSLARKLMDIGTYIAVTQPLGEERARALISNNAAAADMNWILDYFRRSADHRLLFGGRVSYSGIDPFDSAQRAAQADRAGVSAAHRCAHRIRLGWLPRHHPDSCAALRAPRPQCLFRAGSVRSRHGHLRDGRQARQRSRSAARPSASTSSRASGTGTFPAARGSAARRWCWRCCGSASWT